MNHYKNSPLYSTVLPLLPQHLNSVYSYTDTLDFYHMGMGLYCGIDSQTSALDNNINSVKCNGQTARNCNTWPLNFIVIYSLCQIWHKIFHF